MGRRVAVFVLFALVLCSVTLTAGARVLTVPGGTLWSSRFDGPLHGTDYALWAAPSPDGTKVFVAGRTYAGAIPKDDVLTIAYNAVTGGQLWSAKYNGPANGVDTAHVVAVSPDSTKVFVGGQAYTGSTNGLAYVTIAYNAATGAQLWSSRYNGPVNGFDSIYGIAASPDGTKVYVTGRSYQGASKGDDVVTIAYNAATGTKAWTAVYNGTDSLADGGAALALSGDGTKVFVAGYTTGTSSNTNCLTIAYNASTGGKVWDKTYTGPDNHADSCYWAAVGGTKVFVTGSSYESDTKIQDYLTVAYNASTGAQSWAAHYNGPASKDDYGNAVAASTDGTKVFVTGQSYGGLANAYDAVTLAYNGATGAKLWSTRFNGPASGNDAGYSIVAKADGTRVFVTGESAGTGTLADYVTVAYGGGSGGKVWTSRYDGPGHEDDFGLSVVLSPGESRLFVTGKSFGSGTSDDAATIAYQP